MSEHPVTLHTAECGIVAPTDAFDRLTPLGWWGGLAAIVAGLAASFLLFGYALVYWPNADMDFMLIYSPLAMNDGKPQHFLDHTAYLTIVSVKDWFVGLHGLGLLDAYTLPAIPPASDTLAFDAAMTQAVRAGRVLGGLVRAGRGVVCPGLAPRLRRGRRISRVGPPPLAPPPDPA